MVKPKKNNKEPSKKSIKMSKISAPNVVANMIRGTTMERAICVPTVIAKTLTTKGAVLAGAAWGTVKSV
jgi:hypothetical protein